MRADDFRRMALALDGAVEGAHMGHPDFRVNKRIFASLHADGRFGMVTLAPERQREFVAAHPEALAPESGAWGRSGCTRVRLAAAGEELVGEVLTLAWQHVIAKAGAKRSKRKSGRPKPRRPTP